jgi:hypothetical protein
MRALYTLMASNCGFDNLLRVGTVAYGIYNLTYNMLC